MKSEILMAAFKEWLTLNHYEVVSPSNPSEVVFSDSEGNKHTVMFTGMNGRHGAVATDSRYAGALASKFMNEMIGDRGTIQKSEFKLTNGDSSTIMKALEDTVQSSTDRTTPEDFRNSLEKHGAKFHIPNVKLDLINNQYDKLKKLAEDSGNPVIMENVKQIGKLVEMAHLLEGASEDSKLSQAQRKLERLQNEGKLVKECPLKDVQVGQKFFDTDFNFCIAVGFEKGLVGGDYVNSVVLDGGSDETFCGLPIKKPLDEKVYLMRI